jgi:hypothetical protein
MTELFHDPRGSFAVTGHTGISAVRQGIDLLRDDHSSRMSNHHHDKGGTEHDEHYHQANDQDAH